MYRNRNLSLDGVFGYNQLLVNGVDVAPSINTNSQDINYIYNEALINASNDVLNTAKITEAVSSLTQTNTQDIKAIKTSLKEHIDNVKNNYIQRGQDIRFNINLAKFSFPSSFPTTAINNNNTGIGWFWNWSGGAGETDMICYGQSSVGGLSIYGGGNTTNPNSNLICKLWPGNIHFTSTPTFPTTEEIGNYGATTQYVNDKLITQQASNNTTITNLSNQVSALQTTVQANNTTITNLSNQVSTLQTSVQTNNATISRLNSEINAIKRSISF